MRPICRLTSVHHDQESADDPASPPASSLAWKIVHCAAGRVEVELASGGLHIMPDNPTEETVEINWAYTPADFIEEKKIWESRSCPIEIEGGHATARMSAAFYRPGPDFQNALDEELRSYFRLWQLDRRRVFEIRGPWVRHIHPDGTVAIIQVMNELTCTFELQPCNPILTGPDGVVHDPRRERSEKMKNRAQLWLRHASDPTICKMLYSFNQSVREPEIELVRLYEVGEALAKAFGGQKAAAAHALGISYRRLDALANNRRLKQGRHSGQHLGTQRDATTEELEEARKSAVEMIDGYLRYLDKRSAKTD